MRNTTTILRGLQGKPQLVDTEYANAVIESLENKDLSMFQEGSEELRVRVMDESSGKANEKRQIAVIEIDGALSYKPRPCSGLTSYVQIKSVFAELISNGYKHIVMEISSPGGQAYQCFETARYVRNLADENGVKITAYVDGQAASGGYVWASIADEIISNPMSSVGSIGCVLAIANDLPKDIKDGKERLFITDKGNKTPFDEEGFIKEEIKEKILADVKEIGAQFDEHVSNSRGISIESIQAMNAESFPAKKALELGLVDKLMEKEVFYSYISSAVEEETKKEAIKLAEENKVEELMAQVAALQTELAESQSEKAEMYAIVKQVAEQREAEAKASLVAKVKESKAVEESDVTQVTNILFNLEDSDRDLMLSVIAKAGEVKVADEEHDDLFKLKSAQIDSEVIEGKRSPLDGMRKMAKLEKSKGAK